MKERIEKEIKKYQEINEKMLRATIPCFTEVDYNRGYIDGLRYALELIKKHEADERLLNSDWGEMEVQGTDGI